jgi:hypothetical protein
VTIRAVAPRQQGDQGIFGKGHAAKCPGATPA